MQHGKPVPEGAGRRGTVHVTLVGGGTALVSEGHSAGAVGGDPRWFITICWDPDLKLYKFLTRFRTQADAGCELCGTAHWDGNTFVNDYEEVIDGNRTKIQDRWTDITANSHTLTEAHDIGNGVMKPYVVFPQHATIAGFIRPPFMLSFRHNNERLKPWRSSLQAAKCAIYRCSLGKHRSQTAVA